MADEKKVMEFRAKFDDTCAKCAGKIVGQKQFGGSAQKAEDAHLISWTRTPRADGLKNVRYHVGCSDLPDNPQIIAAKLAKMNGTGSVPVESKPVASATVPVEPKPATVAATVANPVPVAAGGDFLAGMAAALLPHIEGKIKVSASELSAELEAKIAAAVQGASKVITIENKRTGTTKDMGRQHETFPMLLKLIEGGFNVYMLGSPGSGKSTGAIKAAEALDLRYGYISLSAQTAESKLLGFMDANGRYIETEFYRCYKDGGVFCIDEMDNASANLLTALNSALENGRAAFPCGTIMQHADFVLVATGNTAGYGANPMFPERRPMDAAFRERFVFLQWDYDESLERDLAKGVNADCGKWVDWVQKVRKYTATNFPKLMVTPRASIKGAGLIRNFTPAQVADMVIFKGFDVDSKSRILSANPLPRL